MKKGLFLLLLLLSSCTPQRLLNLETDPVKTGATSPLIRIVLTIEGDRYREEIRIDGMKEGWSLETAQEIQDISGDVYRTEIEGSIVLGDFVNLTPLIPRVFKGERGIFLPYKIEIEADSQWQLISTLEKIKSSTGGVRESHLFSSLQTSPPFLALSKNVLPYKSLAGETNITAWGEGGEETASKAAKIISYLSTILGPYPFEELQILIGNKEELETYPTIITLPGIEKKRRDDALIEGCASMWFSQNLRAADQNIAILIGAFEIYTVWYYLKKEDKQAALNYFNSMTELRKVSKNIDFNTIGDKELKESIERGKAPLFILELQNIMGEDKFLSALRVLIKYQNNQEITIESFHKLLVHFAGGEIAPLFSSYFPDL